MNPYIGLPPRAFWAKAVAARDPLAIEDLWRPRFPLRRSDPIASLGSCFAQHISKALLARGYHWINAEPAPHRLSAADRQKFHYDTFSVRTANIYTVAALLQWVRWSLQDAAVPAEIWTRGGRYFDPFRPTIEPDGFCSADELLALRAQTLQAMRAMFQDCRIFIFTLGLTEAWVNRQGGYVYPLCPGTVAGDFDPRQHVFKNYTMFEIYHDLEQVVGLLRMVNPAARLLLTVSPVPLTATASSDHVLVATVRSKSVLRAAVAALVDAFDHVDYFPSYEIVSSFPYRGSFFEPDLRSVSAAGIDHLMTIFCSSLEDGADVTPGAETPSLAQMGEDDASDVICEEMSLGSYEP